LSFAIGFDQVAAEKAKRPRRIRQSAPHRIPKIHAMTAAPPPLLAMRGISKRFGATQALANVSLDVAAGEVLALIGENGAGKSTLMKILSGAVAPDAGTMELCGRPYAPRSPQDARREGVAMIYQELSLAPHLSVEENILLGREHSRCGFVRRSSQRELARRVLERLGHADLPLSTEVARLSVGMQQIVEIARALAAEARVIVFDEPTSSLTGHDARRLFETIRGLRAEGHGIVFISHFLEEVRECCTRYTVLREGQVAGSGSLDGVTEKEIVSLMVGRTIEDLFPHVPHAPGEVLLRIAGLTGRKAPRNLTLDVRRGEILGIAGLVGSGRTELLRCLFALDPVRRGEIRVGKVALPATPAARIAGGMGFVSEDRKTEGLAQSMSIADNLTLSRLAPYARWGWLRLGQRNGAARDWMRRLGIRAGDAALPVAALSGGNQQKVAVARILHQGADLLLLDEPTRGIDVGTKSQLYRIMGELAAAGKAVIFVSSYTIELLAVCDRVAVMSRGELRGVRPAREWTEEDVLTCAVSSDGGAAG
jgi:ribose transport system ATP-binding protein